jgi:hypothetical protein
MMTNEIKLAIQRFAAGVITYTELLQAICSILSTRPEQADEILLSLADLPDPLLSELPEDVRRVLANSASNSLPVRYKKDDSGFWARGDRNRIGDS